MLAHSQPTIEQDDINAVTSVMNSGMIACGAKVEEFEERFKRYIGGKYAIATNSGRSALLLALSSLGLDCESEVIMPAYFCRSAYDSVRYLNAKPVIVDVDDDYCISPMEVEKKITPNTKAIIVVHVFGITAAIAEIVEVAKKRGICVIEDCAHSAGGVLEGKKLGSFGDCSFFSFSATKLLTTGEGGLLLLNSPEEDILKYLIDNKDFFYMSDIQASLGIRQIEKLDRFIDKRKKLAKVYIECLGETPDLIMPIFEKNIFFRFPVKIAGAFNFEDFKGKMSQYGVQVRRGVDTMLHQIDPGWRCPNADRLFEQTVSLPIYPKLEECDVIYICNSIKEILNGC